MKLAFVFPGQGSQSVGMMAGWGDRAEVRATFAEASDALGQDLWALVADGPADLLNQTVNTQPAMLAADVAVWRVWQAADGATPALLAGHSLGEYAALVAAGALNFTDAIRLVRFRAEAMQAAVPEGVGAMAAILGLDDDAVRAVCSEAAAGEVVEAVNLNSPGQVVIAGNKAAVERAMALAKQLHTPVRWVETVQALKAAGIERVIECGPGKVLAGLAKRIDDSLPAVALVDEASLAAALSQ
jgi:[acyl-carrier-protein] S-malonyltransferase